MPLFKAVLSVEECGGVSCIEPSADRSWGLRCRCIACSQESATFVYVVVGELHAGKGGGFHQMMYKCSECRSVISADIVPRSISKYCCDKAGEAGNGAVVTFDLRGGEPIQLELDDQWNVMSDGGEQFSEVDLSDDWVEYDEKNGVSMSIMGVSVTFEKVTKK